MMNTKKFKERMKELGLTQTEVAASLGIAQSTFNQKINNSRPMMLEEAQKLQIMLRIKNSEVNEYFFYQEVAK